MTQPRSPLQEAYARLCVEAGLCAPEQAEAAIQLARRSLSGTMDVLDVLTDQGHVTKAQSKAIRSGLFGPLPAAPEPKAQSPAAPPQAGADATLTELPPPEALAKGGGARPAAPQSGSDETGLDAVDWSDWDDDAVAAPEQRSQAPAPPPAATPARPAEPTGWTDWRAPQDAVLDRSGGAAPAPTPAPPQGNDATMTQLPPHEALRAARDRAAAPADLDLTCDFDAHDLATAVQSGSEPNAPRAPRSDEPRALCAGPAQPGTSFSERLLGRVLGGCSLEREVGRGAMGVVFEGMHLSLQRRVAVKVLLPNSRRDEIDVELFVHEARSLARIEHANIVQVYDVGNEGDVYYIVMQLLDGESLAQKLERERALPWEEACRLVRDVALGLETAHAKGIVHRDIKPENLLLTSENVVKIADFGLAAQLVGEDAKGQRTEVMGTPAYMPPEQIHGLHVDGRADLYSLGCTLYVLLTGRKPFPGESVVEVLMKHTEETATPVHKLVPKIPMTVSRVVEKLMAKSADARFPSAGELAAELTRLLQGDKPQVVAEIESVMSRMETLLGEVPTGGTRLSPMVALAGSLVSIAVAGIGLLVALPEVKADTDPLPLPEIAPDAMRLQAEGVLAEAEAFAIANPLRREEVEARYLQVSALHGRTLGDAIAVSRHRAMLAFEKLRDERLAKVEKAAAAALAADDPARAAHLLFSFPEELRTEDQGKLWADALGPVLARVQETTGMAYVPGGERHIGAGGDTRRVKAFLIDLCEVSNEDYAAFVTATGARVPGQWPDGRPSPEQTLLPVVGVTASEAEAYARWKGKRLPTAVEWEAAARGEESRHYPWGEEFDMGRCTSRGSPVVRLVGVRTLPGGRALCGAFHMAGNAAEWTADSVADPLLGTGRIVRGGSAKSHPSACTTFASYAVDAGERDPELLIGFRCVQDVKLEEPASTPSDPKSAPSKDAEAPATPEEPQHK